MKLKIFLLTIVCLGLPWGILEIVDNPEIGVDEIRIV